MRTRRNQGLFERLRGPSSTSYRGELQKRRAQAKHDQRERQHQARLKAQREREAQREELRREKEQIRAANKLKRELLKEEARERKAEAREKAQRRTAERLSAAAIERAYKRGAKTLGEAMEMAERGNPSIRVRPSSRFKGRWEVGVPGYPVQTKKSKRGALSLARRIQAQEGGEIIELDEPAESRPLPKFLQNPRSSKGEFQRCVEAVSARGGAYDPEAVCAARERRKYGQKELTRRAVAGKKAAARKRGKRNPADAAMAVSEEFHGRKVKAMVPVQQKRHYHKYLAELGELRNLEVVTRDGKHKVTLTKFDGAMLCSNEDKNQLFIVDGDQSVNLSDFGIRNPHEIETLGEVVKIEYFTDKEHLGSEGGTAIYVHKFRTTNGERGHRTVRLARNPDLIYYLRDEHLEFSGGSYEIRAEGIDK